MPEREQIRKQPADRSDETIDDNPAASETATRLAAELDDLLDEIDEVLETNAEEFVRSFVQKGGQ